MSLGEVFRGVFRAALACGKWGNGRGGGGIMMCKRMETKAPRDFQQLTGSRCMAGGAREADGLVARKTVKINGASTRSASNRPRAHTHTNNGGTHANSSAKQGVLSYLRLRLTHTGLSITSILIGNGSSHVCKLGRMMQELWRLGNKRHLCERLDMGSKGTRADQQPTHMNRRSPARKPTKFHLHTTINNESHDESTACSITAVSIFVYKQRTITATRELPGAL